MGKPVIRKGTDMSVGHCFSPVAAIQASGDVFANSIPVVRQGDAYPPHSCGPKTHAGKALSASNQVFVNGKLIHRTGDPLSCGDTAGQGSSNVFAG